ncbi:hypothetical protein AVEN_172106-1 [Araneus ventricosus]|uniref:Uncharacterized protein n=1 Tax=Araneus ventricosus TaxID=182803 RepID=A0A4Y2C369_ARAVE|nr:hypothetical protein AVEN_172106-1 [Araneus ventricosus]
MEIPCCPKTSRKTMHCGLGHYTCEEAMICFSQIGPFSQYTFKQNRKDTSVILLDDRLTLAYPNNIRNLSHVEKTCRIWSARMWVVLYLFPTSSNVLNRQKRFYTTRQWRRDRGARGLYMPLAPVLGAIRDEKSTIRDEKIPCSGRVYTN